MTTTGDKNILDPKEYNQNSKNILILDDVMLGPQNQVEQLFVRGRHNNINVIYIAQTYFILPCSTVRSNSYFLIFFKQSKKNIFHIFQDHVALTTYHMKCFVTFVKMSGMVLSIILLLLT